MPRMGRRPGEQEFHVIKNEDGDYEHVPGPRTNGWKREPKSYWSDDPVLAFRGACPHPRCECTVSRDDAKMENVRVCLASDCPWGLPGPPAEKSPLEKRFAGIDFD